MLTYVVIAIVVGLGLAAVLFHTWTLFLLGLLVIIPYSLVLLAPVWLSRTTSVAQDTPDLTEGDNEATVNVEPGSSHSP